MDFKDTIEEVKKQLKNYLTDKGITKKKFRCLNPAHEDKHPSMCYIEKSNTVFCHSCGETYTIFDLLGMDLGLGPRLKGKDFITVLKYACERYNIEFPDNNETSYKGITYIERCHDNVIKTDYFKNRGISCSTIQKFKLGYDENYKINNEIIKAVIIPTSPTSYTARNTDNASKNRYHRSYGDSHILNIEALNTNVPIVLVEGEFDALSLIDAGFESIALSGVQNTDKLIKEILDKRFENHILIALDNDEVGQQQSLKISEKLSKYNIKNKIISPYGDFKDANEAYLKNRNNLIVSIAKEVRNSYNENLASTQFNQLKDIFLDLSKDKQQEIIEFIKKYQN